MILFKIGFIACLIELILLFIKPKWATLGRELPDKKKSIKKLATATIALLLISIFTSEKAPITQTTNIKGESKQETIAPKDEPKKEEVKKDDEIKSDGAIKQGTYKVGTDIQASEYLVISNGRGYYSCSKNSTGEPGSIIFNENLTDGSNSYVTLKDGDYFKLTNAVMYPIDKAPSVIPKDGVYKDSRYEVGDIIANENVTADTYLTVKDGEYLRLTGLQVQKN
ncbi:hypothetical protein [Clostridium sp. YIM B02500]|uniref:hypothetical protein n=1 Tax=Clostridium sp. YIM B02500 TaxID=2910681 RepID=UPI001EED4518|nr:hypothetical protein [Clostridium sp. YIM B02500]